MYNGRQPGKKEIENGGFFLVFLVPTCREFVGISNWNFSGPCLAELSIECARARQPIARRVRSIDTSVDKVRETRGSMHLPHRSCSNAGD